MLSGGEGVVNMPGEDLLQLQETTIVFSFKADKVSGRQGLFSRDASGFAGDGNHLSIFIQNGVLTTRMQDGDSEIRLTGAQKVTADTEYHVAVTFGDGFGTMMVNGEIVAVGGSDLTWATSPEAIQIGALGWNSKTGADGYSLPFNGEISDVAIYDKILDTDQVTTLMNAESPVAPQPEPESQPEPEPEPEPSPTGAAAA
jgi:hypothetical protein